MEHLAQRATQVVRVRDIGQQAVDDDTPEFGEEAGARQDAAVGEESDQPARRQQPQHMATHVGRTQRIGLEQFYDRHVSGHAAVDLARIARPHEIEQRGQRAGGVPVRIGKRRQRGGGSSGSAVGHRARSACQEAACPVPATGMGTSLGSGGSLK